MSKSWTSCLRLTKGSPPEFSSSQNCLKCLNSCRCKQPKGSNCSLAGDWEAVLGPSQLPQSLINCTLPHLKLPSQQRVSRLRQNLELQIPQPLPKHGCRRVFPSLPRLFQRPCSGDRGPLS